MMTRSRYVTQLNTQQRAMGKEDAPLDLDAPPPPSAPQILGAADVKLVQEAVRDTLAATPWIGDTLAATPTDEDEDGDEDLR
jgi:hypothetical protein